MAGAPPTPRAGTPTLHYSNILAGAGFPASVIPQALGVMSRESSYNPDTINTKAPCGSGVHAVGLLQICQNHCGSNGLSSDLAECTAQLQDPAINLQVAHALWSACRGGSFDCDWPATAHGPVGHDPTVASQHVNGPSGIVGTLGDIASGTVSAVSAIPDFLKWLTTAATWARLGKGFLGVMFVLLGAAALLFVVVNKASGGKAASGAKHAAELAAIA